MTFDEFCAQFKNLTEEERTELVWRLATYRMRRTVETLTAERQEYLQQLKGTLR